MRLPRWLQLKAQGVERDALARARETGEFAFPEPATPVLLHYPSSAKVVRYMLYDTAGWYNGPPPSLAGSTATTRLTRYCTVCGDELPADSVFCVSCGRAVADMIWE